MDKQRTYICIDLKSFYASVECIERGLDPLLTNLVVADETRTDKTICLAVSPSLKALGLPGRCRLFEAKEVIRQRENDTGQKIDYIIAPPRMAKYVEYSSDIFSIYLRYIAPEDVHVYSIDEVFMDITDYMDLYKMNAEELTMTMIREVLSEKGITATAGIGPNMYLAKIAMDIVAKHVPADENGVRMARLDEMSFRRLLWDHKPLTDFWSIGPGISRRLRSRGIETIGDLAEASIKDEDWLFKEFGVDAEFLIDHAWGYEPCTMKDIKNYKPKMRSLTQGQVLSRPYAHKETRIIVREMTELLILDMLDKEVVADSVTLSIGYDRENVEKGWLGETHRDFYGREIPDGAHGTAAFDTPTNSVGIITDGMMALFDRIADPALTARRISVCANNVKPEGYAQFSLFEDVEKREKEKRAQKAMLTVRKRFGKNAMVKGTDLQEGATTIARNAQIGGHKA